jgi:hypothetical protein
VRTALDAKTRHRVLPAEFVQPEMLMHAADPASPSSSAAPPIAFASHDCVTASCR